jgi:AsmA protein
VKLWAKILLGFIAAGVIAVAGAVVALKVLFPPERIKEIAVKKLVSELGREIKLAEASIGLGGVSLKKLEVSEVPNFKAGTAATLESLSLKVDWHPLIVEKEFRVTELFVDGLALSVVAREDGSLNLGDKPKNTAGKAGKPTRPATARPSPSPKRPDHAAGAPKFSLDRLEVTNGSIRYKDLKNKTEASVSGLGIAASDVGFSDPFELDLGAQFDYGGKKGRLDFAGTLDPRSGDLEQAGVAIKGLQLLWEGKQYNLAGELRPASAPKGLLTVKLPPLEAGGVSIPMLQGSLKASYTGGLLALRGLDLRGDGASLSGDVLQTRTGWKLSGVNAALEGFSIRLDGSYAETDLDLRLRSEKVDLKAARRWAKALAEAKAEGAASIDLVLKGPPSAPAVSGAAGLTQASFASSGQTLSELDGKVNFTPKRVDATLDGKLNGSPLDVNFSASGYRGNRPKIALRGTLAKLDLEKFLQTKKTSPGTSADETAGESGKEKEPSKTYIDAEGSIEIGSIAHPQFNASTTTMNWDLRRLGDDLSKLDGKVAFRVGEGKFDDLKKLGAASPAAKIVLLPLIIIQSVSGVPLLPNFDNVTFTEIVGDYAIAKGLMTVNKSHLDANVAHVARSPRESEIERQRRENPDRVQGPGHDGRPESPTRRLHGPQTAPGGQSPQAGRKPAQKPIPLSRPKASLRGSA